MPSLPFFKKKKTLYCQVQWNGFFSEYHLSLAFQNYMKMTQTQGGEVLLRCLWSSLRRACLAMTRDSEGYAGRNDQRACTAWWIIPRNVNRLGLCCKRTCLASWGVCRANNGDTNRPAGVSPSGVSCKYALTILLQPHQSWQIWQDPFVPNKESKHSWSCVGGTSPSPILPLHLSDTLHQKLIYSTDYPNDTSAFSHSGHYLVNPPALN